MGIAAILSLIAFALTDRARTVTSLLANHIAAAEAEALADAAVHHAVLTLMHGPEGQEFVPRPPRSYLLELGSGGVEVAVSDEDGKIDLNAAPPVLIANLFQGVGTSSEAAAAVVAAIVARREPEAGPGFPDASDDLARPSAIFPTLGALQGVEGMDEGLYRRVRPYLTVFGQGEGVDPRAADPLVAASIPGIGPELALRIVAGDEEALETAWENEDAAELIYESRLTVYGVRAEAHLDGGTFVREAVIELTGDPADPFLVLAWQEGEARARDDPG